MAAAGVPEHVKRVLAARGGHHRGRWCDRHSVILSISVCVHFTRYSVALFKGDALLKALLLGTEGRRSLPALPAAPPD